MLYTFIYPNDDTANCILILMINCQLIQKAISNGSRYLAIHYRQIGAIEASQYHGMSVPSWGFSKVFQPGLTCERERDTPRTLALRKEPLGPLLPAPATPGEKKLKVPCAARKGNKPDSGEVAIIFLEELKPKCVSLHIRNSVSQVIRSQLSERAFLPHLITPTPIFAACQHQAI